MFFILLLGTIIVYFLFRHYRRVSHLPPGPFSLPIIGNIPQVLYHAWSKGGIVPVLEYYHKLYGNIFTIWLGPIPHVNIADFETAHEMFVKNGSKYADKFIPDIFEYDRKGLGVVASNGEIWQELRRFSLQTFRDMGVGRDLMESRIMEELNARCAEMDSRMIDGEVIQSAADFFDLTVGSIINSILVGKRFEEHNKHEFLQLKKCLDDAMESFSPFDMSVPVWFLQRFFPARFNFQMNTQKNAREFVSRDVLPRIKDFKDESVNIDPENFRDYVDAFIYKWNQEEKTNGKNPAYSLDSLKIILLDLWITGQETTTTTLISGFNQFMNKPKVMQKLREELIKVTNNGTRSLSLKDRNDTPYLNATIAEIQRHASILNVNFWKVNHELTRIGSYAIDSGTLITAQLSILHKNEQLFPRNEDFYPERFMENEKLLQQVIPFGVGKRSCLGESLAKAELYLIIGNLILRYNFRPNGDIPPVSDQLPFSAAKRPYKLTMRVSKIL